MDTKYDTALIKQIVESFRPRYDAHWSDADLEGIQEEMRRRVAVVLLPDPSLADHVAEIDWPEIDGIAASVIETLFDNQIFRCPHCDGESGGIEMPVDECFGDSNCPMSAT